MKNNKISFVLIMLLSLVFLNCNKTCVGYFLYEIDDYEYVFYDRIKGKAMSSYDSIKYSNLRLDIFPSTHKIDEYFCSGMKDSIKNPYISSFIIESNTNYNSHFLKGDDLTNLFLTQNYSSDTLTLQEYMIQYHDNYNFYLFFKEKPDSNQLHIFTITITLEDETKYQLTTIPIIITP